MSLVTKTPPIVPTPIHSAEVATSGSKTKAVVDPKLKKASEEFEAMFVRQILTTAKIGGDKQDGYSGMAVDAIASAVSKGGGLGLAHQIEEAIRRARQGGAKK